MSQDTLLSLEQLDPSPMDSTLELDKQLPDLPPPSPPSRAATLGLSGGGHGAVYYLTRLQRYSSYVFTIYTAMHITNTSILPLCTQSVAASEKYLLLTRPYYQSPFLEPLLVSIPLAIHITSGVLLRIHRRNAAIRRYGSASLPPPTMQAHRIHSRRLRFWPAMSYSSISGYILTPLVLGHVFVNRLLPWWFEGSSSSVGLGFVSHGFAKHPAVAMTGYTALIGIATGHIVWGWAKWLNLTPDGNHSKKSRRGWWKINATAALLATLWMAGGLGVIARGGKASGWVGRGYDDLYAKIPLVDM